MSSCNNKVVKYLLVLLERVGVCDLPKHGSGRNVVIQENEGELSFITAEMRTCVFMSVLMRIVVMMQTVEACKRVEEG